MNPNKEFTFKEKVVDGIDNFFRTKSLIVWIILAVILVVVVAGFVLNNVNQDKASKATLMAENIQEKYADWSTEENEVIKKELEDEFLSLVTDTIKAYPKTYAVQRAFFIRAQFYTEKKEWEKSAQDYMDLATAFPKSVLAQESMLNAVSCYEELGNLQKALSILKDFQTKYPKTHKMAYSLFTAGRIYETSEDYSQASLMYKQLENDFIVSDWTKLAQNRLIALKAKGLISE